MNLKSSWTPNSMKNAGNLMTRRMDVMALLASVICKEVTRMMRKWKKL